MLNRIHKPLVGPKKEVSLLHRHKIQFPQGDISALGQDEVFFYFYEGEERRTVKMHDYEQIFSIPGLYEQVVYDRLHCLSPQKVVANLKMAVEHAKQNFSELRVLDFGAGNGKVGEELAKVGVSRLVGADILPSARMAAERDRPGIYDGYYVADFCALNATTREELKAWSFDCLTVVAALGFGDIPPRALIEAFDLVKDGGWLAFNIKESFLDSDEGGGFSVLIRELIFSKYLDLYSLERYHHRYSFEGEPLPYFSVVARKNHEIPVEFVEQIGAS